jgi:hypothetical protein
MVSSLFEKVDKASARVQPTDVELGIKMDENLLPLPAAADLTKSIQLSRSLIASSC